MKNSQIYPLSRSNDLVMLEAKDEILIYDLKSNNALCLNHTAAIVWQNCDGKNSIEDLTEIIQSKLKTQINEEFVYFALKELEEKNLLQKDSFPAQIFSSLSRRDAIRKLSFATMAAIPLISLIAVPTAGQAGASCVAITDPCTPAGTPCCPGAGVCQVNRCCNLSTQFCVTNVQCCSGSCNNPTGAGGVCNP